MPSWVCAAHSGRRPLPEGASGSHWHWDTELQKEPDLWVRPPGLHSSSRSRPRDRELARGPAWMAGCIVWGAASQIGPTVVISPPTTPTAPRRSKQDAQGLGGRPCRLPTTQAKGSPGYFPWKNLYINMSSWASRDGETRTEAGVEWGRGNGREPGWGFSCQLS